MAPHPSPAVLIREAIEIIALYASSDDGALARYDRMNQITGELLVNHHKPELYEAVRVAFNRVYRVSCLRLNQRIAGDHLREPQQRAVDQLPQTVAETCRELQALLARLEAPFAVSAAPINSNMKAA